MADGVLDVELSDNSHLRLSKFIKNRLHNDLDPVLVEMQVEMTTLQLQLRHFSILPTNYGISAILDGHHIDFERKLNYICEAFKVTDFEQANIKVKHKRFFYMNLKKANASNIENFSVEALWHRCTELHNLLDHLMTRRV